ALLTLAGGGVLLALGVARRSLRGVLAAAGLAYLTGVALAMLAGIALVTLGAAYSVPLLAAVCAAIAVGGAAIASRRGAAGAPRGEPVAGALRPVLALLGVLAGAYLL